MSPYLNCDVPAPFLGFTEHGRQQRGLSAAHGSDHRYQGTSRHANANPVEAKKKKKRRCCVSLGPVRRGFPVGVAPAYLLRHGGPAADQLKVPFSIATSSPSEQKRGAEVQPGTRTPAINSECSARASKRKKNQTILSFSEFIKVVNIPDRRK